MIPVPLWAGPMLLVAAGVCFESDGDGVNSQIVSRGGNSDAAKTALENPGELQVINYQQQMNSCTKLVLNLSP